MKIDDYLYGCRSGIQKAVRRGDLDLGKTCFDALWGNKTHRAWLQWRMPVLVMEETSYMVGEWAEFEATRTVGEKEWRRFLYELIIAPKAKDGTGLLRLARAQVGYKHRELSWLRSWFKNENVDPSTIMSQFIKEVFKERDDLSDYERRAISFLQKRSGMGGMLGDRQLCLTNIVLIRSRDLDKEQVRGFVDEHVEAYVKNHGKPVALEELPWYIFDMHTVVGKIALSILSRKKISGWKISEEELRRIWFLFESGVLPRSQFVYSEIKEDPTPFESIWLIPSIVEQLKGIKKMAPRALLEFWKREIEPEVKSVVEWVLRSREGE